MDWEKAEKYLKDIRMRYTEIGMSGMPALQVVINPLLLDFEGGDRTQELYDKIMKLE